MIVLIALAFVPFKAALEGYVVSVLWNWFVVPTLGVPHLSVLPAIGFDLLVTALTYRSDLHSKHEKTGAAEAIATSVAGAVIEAAVYLGMGGIVHWLWVN